MELIEGLEFREVFTVTRATAGIANNVVPSEFVLNLNYRFPPSLTVAEATERLHAVAAPADEVAVHDVAPAGKVPEGNKHLLRFESLLGGERLPKQGWTDVARLTEHGIPAVNYGPGDPAPGASGRGIGASGQPHGGPLGSQAFSRRLIRSRRPGAQTRCG